MIHFVMTKLPYTVENHSPGPTQPKCDEVIVPKRTLADTLFGANKKKQMRQSESHLQVFLRKEHKIRSTSIEKQATPN